jgi:hypothetical protein
VTLELIMNDATFHDAEMALRAGQQDSPTAFRNWHLSDRAAQTEVLTRVARIRSRRLRLQARRRLVNRLYRDPLPAKIRTSALR